MSARVEGLRIPDSGCQLPRPTVPVEMLRSVSGCRKLENKGRLWPPSSAIKTLPTSRAGTWRSHLVVRGAGELASTAQVCAAPPPGLSRGWAGWRSFDREEGTGKVTRSQGQHGSDPWNCDEYKAEATKEQWPFGERLAVWWDQERGLSMELGWRALAVCWTSFLELEMLYHIFCLPGILGEVCSPILQERLLRPREVRYLPEVLSCQAWGCHSLTAAESPAGCPARAKHPCHKHMEGSPRR